uniref:Uncharacterized protein n=1 Tax=Arundo donax TaxID=35708 RepID=A0A0A9B3B2_ARUDO
MVATFNVVNYLLKFYLNG